MKRHATTIAKRLRKGQLVILESTTYPGTTEELVLPELEKTGLKSRKRTSSSRSRPERVDPSNDDLRRQEHAQGRRRRRTTSRATLAQAVLQPRGIDTRA